MRQKYLVGHEIKHHRGQYMCPSCKSVFKTETDLDIHIKSNHEKRRTVQQYKCEKCEQKFGEMYKMRHHFVINHGHLSNCAGPGPSDIGWFPGV